MRQSGPRRTQPDERSCAQDFTKTEAIVADMRRYLHSDPDFDHELHQSAAVESLDQHAVNIAVHCHTSAAATREFCAHLPSSVDLIKFESAPSVWRVRVPRAEQRRSQVHCLEVARECLANPAQS